MLFNLTIGTGTDRFASSSKISPPSGADIRAVVCKTPDGPAVPRPRGTGKLLTVTHDVGLALLRLEQVESVQNGTLSFEVDADGAQKLPVVHWWPDWWPHADIAAS